MILARGDMFSQFHSCEVFLVTCNSTITHDGRVVMGRGAAAQLKLQYPGIDKVFGRIIGNESEYGIVTHPALSSPMVGLFQVKHHWSNPAELQLIHKSVGKLHTAATTILSDSLIYLNFPGIGNGKLKRDDVVPLLIGLPDNVVIWEL